MLRKLESLQGVSILSKEAQKKIAGGGTCAYYLPTGSASGGPIVTYNVSAADAQWWAGQGGGRWCCDSCSTASWYGQNVQMPQ
jgi:hypothetical protein